MYVAIKKDAYNVIINSKRCNDCGDCIEVCPDNILKVKEELVISSGYCKEPECRACQETCQNNAIYLK